VWGGSEDDERLDRAPFRFPLPLRSSIGRWSVAAALMVLAGLVLLTGSPPGCPTPPAPLPTRTRPVPPEGTVGVPVTLSVPGAAAVVRPGDRVDVVTGTAGVLAQDVLVLAVHLAADGPPGGAALYVAAPAPVARRLAGVAPETPLAITVRPP
jgi:hypothetical protein